MEGQKKIAGLQFATWVNGQADTMPNMTIEVGSLKLQNFLCQSW